MITSWIELTKVMNNQITLYDVALSSLSSLIIINNNSIIYLIYIITYLSCFETDE